MLRKFRMQMHNLEAASRSKKIAGAKWKEVKVLRGGRSVY